ncbi:hypothetical protein V8F20_004647 [Naviculisporaceae sp. PSN 640]
MSYPGQFADPRQRPPSGMSAASTLYPNPHAPRQQQFKEYGQDYQFAETWTNPPPQAFVHPRQSYHQPAPAPLPAPAPVAAPSPAIDEETPQRGAGINAEVRDLFRDDEGTNSKEAGWAPSKKPWYKRMQNKWWVIAGITFGGILAVILAILGGIGVIGDHSSVSLSATDTPSGELTTTRLPDGSSLTSSSTTTPTTTPTGTASTTASRPTSTDLIKDCSNKDSYVTNASFVSLGDHYESTYDHPASNGEDCCQNCFDDPTCGAWQFDGGNKFTPCTLIHIKLDLGGGDDTCPNGYTSTTITTSSSAKMVAGIGPCSNAKDVSVSTDDN